MASRRQCSLAAGAPYLSDEDINSPFCEGSDDDAGLFDALAYDFNRG